MTISQIEAVRNSNDKNFPHFYELNFISYSPYQFPIFPKINRLKATFTEKCRVIKNE